MPGFESSDKPQSVAAANSDRLHAGFSFGPALERYRADLDDRAGCRPLVDDGAFLGGAVLHHIILRRRLSRRRHGTRRDERSGDEKPGCHWILLCWVIRGASTGQRVFRSADFLIACRVQDIGTLLVRPPGIICMIATKMRAAIAEPRRGAPLHGVEPSCPDVMCSGRVSIGRLAL